MRKILAGLVFLVLVGCPAPKWSTGCKATEGGFTGRVYHVDDSRPIIITEAGVMFYGVVDMSGESEEHDLAVFVIIRGRSVMFSRACATPQYRDTI